MTKRSIAWVAALAGLAWAAPSHACSVVGDYVRPSNFELVQIADAIAIATPEARVGENVESGLVFRVETAIKGAPPQRVTLGMAGLGRTSPSNLADLSGSHPEGHAGPCNRATFAQGARYLLFLARAADGNWHQLGYPFSRVSEDYAGENNDWMRSVRRYLALQTRLPPMDQIAALARMAETGRGAEGEALSTGERADIRDHLGAISPWKPTAWLLDAHARLERGAALPFAARPDAANGEQGGLDRVAAVLLDEPAPPAAPQGAERERLLVLRALTTGDHAAALPLFERLSAAPGTGPGTRGLVLRFLARNGHYPRAYQWIETQLMAALPRLGARDARQLIADVAQVQRGDSFEEGRERWRTDPHAAATWPELALALYWYQARSFGEREALGFSDAVRAIAVTDYRARPELTLVLAGGFDQGVIDWALAELARPPRPPASDGGESDGESDGEDPALLPLRVVASAWVAEHGPVLLRAFCQGGERRRLAILALGQWGDGLYQDELATMAATPGLSAEEKSWLLRAAIEMSARDIRESGRTTFLPDEEEGWLVTRLARGQPPGGRPHVCPG